MKQTIRSRFYNLRWRFQNKAQRASRAWRYLAGKMTEGDAYQIFHECEDVTGFYCLEGISRESVLDSAKDRYGDVPGLETFVDDACSRVAHKWSSTGDIASAAEDWAFDLIPEYAAADGVTLVDQWDAPAEAETEDA